MQIDQVAYPSKCLLAIPNGRIAIAVYHLPTLAYQSERGKLICALNTVGRELLGEKCFLGVSAPFSTEEDLHKAYLQIMETMNYSIYYMGQDCLSYEDKQSLGQKINMPRQSLDINEIRILLKTQHGRSSAQEKIIQGFRRSVQWDSSNQNVINVYQEMLTQINDLGREENQQIDEQIRQCYEHLQTVAKVDSSMKQLESNLLKMFTSTITMKEQGQTCSVYIAQALRFIDENIAEKLSLKVVADNIGISRIYLSQLFRREMQTTYSQYILKHRIDTAKWMLRNTNKRICEICNQVGFNEVQYFSLKFRELTGMSATEYRKDSALVCKLQDIAQ